LSANAFSVAGQSPSSALVSSSLGVTGQLARAHDAPCAVLPTLAGSSPRASKNSRQPASIEYGSFSYLACIASM
jgi:hypothetical protein